MQYPWVEFVTIMNLNKKLEKKPKANLSTTVYITHHKLAPILFKEQGDHKIKKSPTENPQKSLAQLQWEITGFKLSVLLFVEVIMQNSTLHILSILSSFNPLTGPTFEITN